MAAVNTKETLKELSIEISLVRIELIKQNLVIISFKKHKLGSALGDVAERSKVSNSGSNGLWVRTPRSDISVEVGRFCIQNAIPIIHKMFFFNKSINAEFVCGGIS